MTPHSAVVSKENEIVLLVSGSTGKWVQVTIKVQDHEPYSIIMLIILESEGPDAELGAAKTVKPDKQ